MLYIVNVLIVLISFYLFIYTYTGVTIIHAEYLKIVYENKMY